MNDYKVTAQDQHGNVVVDDVTAESMNIDGGSLTFFVKGEMDYDMDLIAAYAPLNWTSAKRVV